MDNHSPAWRDQVMQQLFDQNAKLDKFCGMLAAIQMDVNAMKSSNFSSSSSGRRLMCPLECGADFKKVCENTVIVRNPVLSYSQATYLLDHLCRSTKISKRTTVKTACQDCVFDMSNSHHQTLWNSVFITPTPLNDQNVPLC
jgi:hypothetical protein